LPLRGCAADIRCHAFFAIDAATDVVSECYAQMKRQDASSSCYAAERRFALLRARNAEALRERLMRRGAMILR